MRWLWNLKIFDFVILAINSVLEQFASQQLFKQIDSTFRKDSISFFFVSLKLAWNKFQ